MMDVTNCNGTRGEELVAYLYDDLEAPARAGFETHLAGCETCRSEMASLRGIRRELARWSVPEPSGGFTPGVAPAPGQMPIWRKLQSVPVWAQTAAAMLVLGATAGLANLNVRYDDNGITIRTGWSRPAPAVATTTPAPAPASRADLEALAAQLRSEFEAGRAQPQPVAADVDAARVQTLIAESERRQDREMALRFAELARDMQVQRRGDLEKIQYSLGIMESNLGVMQNLGVEVMRQREMINDLAVPASQGR